MKMVRTTFMYKLPSLVTSSNNSILHHNKFFSAWFALTSIDRILPGTSGCVSDMNAPLTKPGIQDSLIGADCTKVLIQLLISAEEEMRTAEPAKLDFHP